ncbi:MAG TPA: carboxypeptidase-like regulatory domain-containing protein [Terriglobia bacterium]|nr:carboxypeptidase-like regulatory domain-containing protein [Terriglobia bacterium]
MKRRTSLPRYSALTLGAACAIVAFLCLAFTAIAQQRSDRVGAGSIAGTISWRNGMPAAGIRVGAIEENGPVRGANVSMVSLAQTDSEGRFRLDAVPRGRYIITAGPLDTTTYFPGTSERSNARTVELGADATVTGLDFRIAFARFAGRIVWQDLSDPNQPSQDPATLDPGSAIPEINLAKGYPGLFAPVAKDGSFEFTMLRPDKYPINLGRQFERYRTEVTIGDEDVVDYRIVVPYTVTVTGSVATDDGAPQPHFLLIFSDPEKPSPDLASALVKLSSPNPTLYAPGRMDSRTGMVSAEVAAIINVLIPTGVYRVSVVDLSSSYEVQSITAGALDLMSGPLKVSAAGLPPIHVVLKTVGTSPWRTIRGRISGRGSPTSAPFTVYGPSITYGVIVSDDVAKQSLIRDSATRPSPVFYLDGTFEIPRLVPGQYLVQPPNTSFSLNPPKTDVTAGDVNDLVIKVPDSDDAPPSSSTYGPRVRGAITGHAIAAPSASVRLTGSNSETLTALIYRNGSFEFAHVPPGVYQAEVVPRIPGAIPVTLLVGPKDLTVEIPVPSTREIPGRVTVDRGAPLPRAIGFTVSGVEISAKTQPDGTFALIAPDNQSWTIRPESLPAGYAIRSMAYGALNLLSQPLRFSTETHMLLIALDSPPPSAVRGHVVGSEKAREHFNTSHVWLTDKTGLLGTLESSVAPDGAFEFPIVSPGAYSLRFAPPGSATGGDINVTVTRGRDVIGIEILATGF